MAKSQTTWKPHLLHLNQKHNKVVKTFLCDRIGGPFFVLFVGTETIKRNRGTAKIIAVFSWPAPFETSRCSLWWPNSKNDEGLPAFIPRKSVWHALSFMPDLTDSSWRQTFVVRTVRVGVVRKFLGWFLWSLWASGHLWEPKDVDT